MDDKLFQLMNQNMLQLSEEIKLLREDMKDLSQFKWKLAGSIGTLSAFVTIAVNYLIK
jgi:hypothetical protein